MVNKMDERRKNFRREQDISLSNIENLAHTLNDIQTINDVIKVDLEKMTVIHNSIEERMEGLKQRLDNMVSNV